MIAVEFHSNLVGPAVVLGVAAAGLYGLLAVSLVLTYRVSRTIGFIHGGIAIFTGSGGKVYNCVLAELEGYRCSFTGKELVYPKLTAALKNLGKGSCVVSDARIIGKTTDEGFVEVACAE